MSFLLGLPIFRCYVKFPGCTFCLVGKQNWKKLYTWILGLFSSQAIFFVGKWVKFTLCLGRKKRRWTGWLLAQQELSFVEFCWPVRCNMKIKWCKCRCRSRSMFLWYRQCRSTSRFLRSSIKMRLWKFQCSDLPTFWRFVVSGLETPPRIEVAPIRSLWKLDVYLNHLTLVAV